MARSAGVMEHVGVRAHVDVVDGLRGVAALFVVLHHVWQYSVTDPDSSAPGWFRIFNVLEYGSFAVAVFIVVSGLCLMLPALRHGASLGPGGLGEFARRRSRRILPPYFAMLALAMVLIALVPALRRVSSTPWNITLPSFSVGNVTSHLLMVHNWFADWEYAFNPPLWTIALEFQIYFVFALLLLPVWRRWGPVVTLGTATAVMAVPWALGRGFARPWMLVLFVFGMIAASVITGVGAAASWRTAVPWRPVAGAAIVAVPVVVAVSRRLDSEELALALQHVTVGIATAAGLIVMAGGGGGRRQRGGVARFLAWRPVRSLGLFSFSLYLVHYPIVALVTIVGIRPLDLDVPTTFAVLMVTAVPASLAAAYGFHVLVERRFLNAPVAATGARASLTRWRRRPRPAG